VVFHLFHILINIYLASMVKIDLKIYSYQSISNLFVTYFYYTIFLKFWYSTYHKPNVGIDVFKMKGKKLSHVLSCVFVKNYYIFKWDFRWTTFLAYFNVLWPKFQTKNQMFSLHIIKWKICFFSLTFSIFELRAKNVKKSYT